MTDNTETTSTYPTYSVIAPVIPRIIQPIPGASQNEIQEVDAVDNKCEDYMEMLAHWELPLYLMKGTLGMRSAGRKFLPQNPAEENSEYSARLARTVLYGVYPRIIKVASSLPFTDKIVTKDIPPELEYLASSCTKDGLPLEAFAEGFLQNAMHMGIAHMLVEYPEVPPGLNAAQERALNPQPYFVNINPVNLINWRIVDGELVFIAIYEYVQVPIGSWSSKGVDRVRIYTKEHFEVWDNDGSSAGWIQTKRIPNPLGKIPLITAYGNKEGVAMKATPVMEELAWLNLKHYQKMSDLDNIEHVVNVPLLFAKGFTGKELDDVVVGVNAFVSTTEQNADMKYIEHTGNSIPYSHKSLEELEKRMMAMGADILSQSATSRQTAFAKSIDTGQSISIMQAIANNVSEALSKAYALAGEWKEVDASKAQAVVGEGLDLIVGSDKDHQLLYTMFKDGVVELKDLQDEYQRKGVISTSTVLKKPKPAKQLPIQNIAGQPRQQQGGQQPPVIPPQQTN